MGRRDKYPLQTPIYADARPLRTLLPRVPQPGPARGAPGGPPSPACAHPTPPNLSRGRRSTLYRGSRLGTRSWAVLPNSSQT